MGFPLLFALLVIALGAAEETIKLKDKDVIDYIKDKSDPDVIPIDSSDPRPVVVRVTTSLKYVVTANEQAEALEIVALQTYTWFNPSLAWSKSRFDVDNVTMPISHLWYPDTVPINSVNLQESLSPEEAIVSSDGEIIYSPQMRIGIHTDLSEMDSSSGAKVTFAYESWGYDNTKLRFENPTNSDFKLDEFESTKYKVSNAMVEKLNRWQPSRSSMHDSLEFSFILKKKD